MGGVTYLYDWESIMPQAIAALEADPELTVEQNAKDLKIPGVALRRHLRAAGLSQYFNRRSGRISSLSVEDWKQIHEGLAQKKSVTQIAGELGRPISTIKSSLQRKNIASTHRIYRFPDELFVPIIEDLDSNSRLSLGAASRKHSMPLPSLIRYLKANARFDLIRRFKKTIGISKQNRRKYLGTREIPGPELGVVFQHRQTKEWVLTVPPHFVVGKTPEGMQLLKIQVNKGQTPEEAFDKLFMYLKFTPTLETLADYWHLPLNKLLKFLDKHAEKYFGLCWGSPGSSDGSSDPLPSSNG